MEKVPLITIITVSFNAAKDIEKTICSVSNQSYSNLEYIIIDGGSKDGTVEIIKRYSKKINFWCSEPDKGIYDAMNKGIKRASGRWLNFMNAGDVFTQNDTIEKISVFLDDDYGVVYGNIIKCFDNYKMRDTGLTMSRKLDRIDFIRNTIHHQASFIRKSLFDKYGLYDTNYRLASDWYFFMKSIGIGGEKSRYVNIDICLFSMTGISTTGHDAYSSECNEIIKETFGPFYMYACELAEYRVSFLSREFMKLRVFIRGSGIGGKIKAFIAFFKTLLINKK